MNDKRTIEARREHLERHARIETLIDRLHSMWTLCTEDNGEYGPVDEGWGKQLAEELEWLQSMYTEALATDGDVRSILLARSPDEATSKDHDVQ